MRISDWSSDVCSSDLPQGRLMGDLTRPLQDAIAEAEKLIESAPFIRTEQDLLAGYDYLAGRIRMAMQMAFDHDLERPLFINPTHQFSRQGLDNPDAIYFNAYLKEIGRPSCRERVCKYV